MHCAEPSLNDIAVFVFACMPLQRRRQNAWRYSMLYYREPPLASLPSTANRTRYYPVNQVPSSAPTILADISVSSLRKDLDFCLLQPDNYAKIPICKSLLLLWCTT